MLDTARGLAERAARDARVSVRSLGDADEMAAASQLWAAVWGSTQSGLQMHPGLLVALAHTGNYVAGAFSGDTLVGAAAGFFHSPGQNALHSHIAGVLPGHTRHGIARALKLHQAAWCLQRELRRSAPRLAADWRRAQRAVFQHLLAAGWVVVGFDAEHGYHWQRRSPDATAGR